jgi:hypothetical protein
MEFCNIPLTRKLCRGFYKFESVVCLPVLNIVSNKAQGGLVITDIYSYSKSDKFMWIKKMMDNSFDSSWKDLIKLLYHLLNISFLTAI